MTAVAPPSPTTLEERLRAVVTGEVRFSAGDRGLYATDASNYRMVPIGVVIPRSLDDVIATVSTCRDFDVPIVSRGGGTSLAGQTTNTAVVIDWSKYLRHVIAIDPGAKRARVQPGCVLDDLRRAANVHGLTFGPDPATHTHCTLGGMVGNNSCGIHSVMSGRTADNVHSLDVLTYDGTQLHVGAGEAVAREAARAGGRVGEIYTKLLELRDRYADEIRARYPRIPRRVSGYNLDELLPESGFHVARALVGSEGTCVTVLEAELDLVDDPPARSLLVVGFPDIATAADAVPTVMEHHPIGCEGVDEELFGLTRRLGLHPDALALMPDGRGWLIVEFGGASKEDSDAQAHDLERALKGSAFRPTATKLFDDQADEHRIWEVRESGLGATAHNGFDDAWPGWEDSAVAPEQLGDYIRGLRALYAKHGYDASIYGHFGQGCVHTRINFNLFSAPGIANFRAFMEDAADLVIACGGSLSGEHGDGQARAELLPKMYGERLVQAFREFKEIWDPRQRMNPGKVVDPNPITGQLRVGSDYAPWEPTTFFAYRDDDHSFAHAAGLRCVGVGECRREGGGTMCPSYMVTREEKHSTRGRARLLYEMMQREVITDGWRSEEVREALDLCLACKGCLGDCPVNVDMATYKAEFLAHHYARRARPAAHYSMGWLPLVARVASRAPRTFNALTHIPPFDTLTKRAGGIDQRREVPRFATQTFRDWFARRPREVSDGAPVVLWPDTFTDHFDPDIGKAAVEVLEAAGYAVQIPDRPLCCGLTWISTGQLKTARRVLRRTIAALAPFTRNGIPVVGLEPSCTAVFRHDLVDLLPDDRDALRLRDQTRTLAELLNEADSRWEPAPITRKAVVQGHCHHQAVMHMEADVETWARAGLEAALLPSGCCGLAGDFGFADGHYDVSVACAERVLLPAVRAAAPGTLLMADGFSCRTQIEQLTGRRALHLAEVLRLAIP